MIDFNRININDFIKQSAQAPQQEEIENFKALCKNLISNTQANNEEFQKNEISKMLKESFNYHCNVKDRIDLCIYDEGVAKVLFEVKQKSNKTEFPKIDNPLSKAFAQSVLYFLIEYLENNNNEIKHIIICNPVAFFIFDASNFTIFSDDKNIKKLYKNTDSGTNTSREKFYIDLQNYLNSEDFNQSIEFTYFELNDENLNNNAILSQIYQLLSPQILLKKKSYIDSNTLNEAFYSELLHILGLKQIDKNNESLIILSDEKNALSDLIAQNLALDKQNDFEKIFSLITTWNNRILFLRLLESMLLSFKHIDSAFLDIDSIPDFKTLSILFFEVLAKEYEKRNIDRFQNIPYLNSSLFEKTELEQNGKEIKLLDSLPLRIMEGSILHKDSTYKQKCKDKKALPFLEYLFYFLHAYSFTTTPKDIIDNTKTNHDKLINSAVLGNVFERLNGYKEGSFYTKSFVTSYMCVESIHKIVLEKFNTHYKWQCKNIKDLYNKIQDEKEANKIIDSLSICDPSVGSGHFLVSALNQLIFIKYELGILLDEDGKKLKDIHLTLENDEILIRDEQNDIHTYEIPAHSNIENHRIQKALFQIKRRLIEECLFGVDINPNSCEITKLRLWIELLKHSFYKDIEKRHLETLPNIDINIKCGNSLISCFDLKDKFKTQNVKNQVKIYKELVKNYKDTNAVIKMSKKEILAKIDDIKNAFVLELKDPKIKKDLDKAIEQHIKSYGLFLLDNDSLLDGLSYSGNLFQEQISLNEEQERQATLSFANIKLLRKKLDDIKSGKAYENAFEWRFAFPEVLDENGDFSGFDLIIGNPPYIRHEEIKNLKPSLQKGFSIYNSMSDIYTYFFELGHNLLKDNGTLSFITSNKYARAGYGKNLREFLLQKTSLRFYIDLNGIKAFDKPSVDTSILIFQKTIPQENNAFSYLFLNAHLSEEDKKNIDKIKIENYQKSAISLSQNSLNKEAFSFSDEKTAALKAKIEKLGTPLKDWDISIYRGILTGYNEAFIIDSATREQILQSCDDTLESTTSRHCEPPNRHSEALAEESTESTPTPPSLRASETSAAIHKDTESRHSTPLNRHSTPPTRHSTPLNRHSEPPNRHSERSEESTQSTTPSLRGEAEAIQKGTQSTERQRTQALIKPILRGRDIKRYSYEWANLWVIGTFPALKLDIEQYPALKNYLASFGKRLEQSGEKNIDEFGNNARKKTTNKWFETSDNIAYIRTSPALRLYGTG